MVDGVRARGFTRSPFSKKKICEKPRLFPRFPTIPKKNSCVSAVLSIHSTTRATSASKKNFRECKNMKNSRKKQSEKEREFNEPLRGCGRVNWTFHPASTKHAEIVEILFHYVSPTGNSETISFCPSGKGGIEVPVRVALVDVLELSFGLEQSDCVGQFVTVNFRIAYGRKRYGNKRRSNRGFSTVPCLRVEFFLQGYKVTRKADGTWNVREAAGVSSRIGCPGYKAPWGNNSEFWLENIH